MSLEEKPFILSKEAEKCFNELAKCGCCITHTHIRVPSKISDEYIDYSFYDKHIGEEKKWPCTCDCRHKRRILNWNYNNQIKPFIF
jgi:hypothetical protein